MTFIIGLFLRAGVPQRFAKPLLIALAVALLIAALGIGKCSYDRSIIETHDAKQDAKIATQARNGEAQAADERRTDDARISNETEEVTHATQALPDKAVSDRQRARACVILRRQAAASGGIAPPGC